MPKRAGPALLVSLDSDLLKVQCCGGLGSAVGAGASKHLLPAKCVRAVGMRGWVGEHLPPPTAGGEPAKQGDVGDLLPRCLRAELPLPAKINTGEGRFWGER